MPLNRIQIENLGEAPPLRQKKPLTVDFPEIAAMWHKNKNGKFKPDQFSHGSNIEVWFKCDAGSDHVFQKAISSLVMARRKGAKGCPACKGDLVNKNNNLARRYPKIAREYLEEKNELPLAKVSYGSSRRVWWCCSKCAHQWQTSISNRTQLRSACPSCKNKTLINLFQQPSVLRYFDKKANKGVNAEKLPLKKSVWWSCKKGPDHRWKARLKPQKGQFCPFCRGSKASVTNSLALTPALAKQLHKTLNGNLKAKDLSMRSFKLVWWNCKKGSDHQWQARINERTLQNAGCPFCRNHRVSHTNNLAKIAPEIAAQWHPTKNGKLTPENVVAYTTKTAWFICEEGHDYSKAINRRVRYDLGCSVCAKLNKAKKTISI